MANPHPRLRRDHGRPVTKQPSVTSKALAILSAFERGRTRLGLSEIARRSGLPITTTQRLLGDLVEWGALERRGRNYVVGSRLWSLSMTASIQRNVTEIASPIMHDVFYATQHSVNLFVLEGSEALLVERVAGSQAGEPLRRVGRRLPLHSSASGKVLLAFGPQETTRDIVRRMKYALEQHTSRTLGTKRSLELELDQVRAAGFATSHGETADQKFAAAVPVFKPGFGAAAALGVITNGEPPVLGSIVPVLRSAAKGISRGLLGTDGEQPEY